MQLSYKALWCFFKCWFNIGVASRATNSGVIMHGLVSKHTETPLYCQVIDLCYSFISSSFSCLCDTQQVNNNTGASLHLVVGVKDATYITSNKALKYYSSETLKFLQCRLLSWLCLRPSSSGHFFFFLALCMLKVTRLKSQRMQLENLIFSHCDFIANAINRSALVVSSTDIWFD